MDVFVGTSGWQYDDWRKELYGTLPKREWLGRFSAEFPTVEVNNTFYNLPQEDTFVRWREESAPGFVFVVKASRYITHIRRLRDARDAVRLLWSRCRRLGKKRGPVLFQLPPNMKADLPRLDAFLRILPGGMRAAIEFRHISWETEEVRGLLDGAGCALVAADWPNRPAADRVTGGWSYFRLHRGAAVRPGYSRAKLARYADRLAGMEASEAWVFFNNDTGGAAIRDARTLTAMLHEREVAVRGPEGPGTTAQAG